MTDQIVYVVGGAGPEASSARRDFPLVKRDANESEENYLDRLTRLMKEAMAEGGTHLLIPREHASWIGDDPLLTAYFIAQHDLVEASPDTGITFLLCPLQPMTPLEGQSRISAADSRPGADDFPNLTTEESLPGLQSRESFPPELEPAHYRGIHADLRHMSDEEVIAHYLLRGRVEGRLPNGLRSREEFRDLALGHGPILEIGPFTRPLFRGPAVKYFDVLDRAGLAELALAIELYEVEQIPEIDYVSPTGDLSIIPDMFSVVASSHAVEHQPDLVRHLTSVANLLQPGGFYFLWVPDKRYCFDHFLPESSIAEVVEAAVEERKFHTLSTLIEQETARSHNDPLRHWLGDHADYPENQVEIIPEVIQLYKRTREAGKYVDRHAWQFTPPSFRKIIDTLDDLGFIKFRVIRVYNTLFGSNEFWAILQKP